jgi:HEAT repeat protein
MMSFSKLNLLTVFSLLCGSLAFGQATTPAPAAPAGTPVQSAPPTAPAQATPPATPAQSTSSSNPLVTLLKTGHTDSVRAKAAHDLGQAGDISTIPALAGALSDPSVKVRREVVLALAMFHQPEALQPLELATRDMDDEVRIIAIQTLVGFYSGEKANVGFTGFVKKNWERAYTHFQPDDTRIDPGISVDPAVINTLITAMKDTRSKDATQEAAKGLGILLATSAAPDLVSAAHSSNEDLAREALNALAKIKDRDSGPKLVDLLDSPNKNVQRDACVTVGILLARQALPKLQSIFQNNPDQKTKEAAMQGLAYLGDPVSVPIFVKGLWSDDKVIRQGAGEGLARAADPKSQPELEKAVSVEKDASARLAMEFALTALGKKDALDDVVSELSSKIRGDVARAYLTELARNPAFLPKLYPYLQSPDRDIRKRLCVVLMYSGDQGSLAQLDRLANDPDREVAEAALHAKRAIRARLDAAATATTG